MNYIIFSYSRTGSTSLALMINALEAKSCILEPFTPGNHGSHFLKRALYEDLEIALAEIWTTYRGIKHVWNKGGWPFPLRYSDYNRKLAAIPGCAIVILYRRNTLKRIISEEIAKQSGVWRIDTISDQKRRSDIKYQHLDMNLINRRLNEETRDLVELKEFLAKNDQKSYELTYESLFNLDVDISARKAAVSNLFRFLEISHTNESLTGSGEIMGLLTPSKEQFSSDIFSLVPNIVEIEKVFGSEAHGFVFDK